MDDGDYKTCNWVSGAIFGALAAIAAIVMFTWNVIKIGSYIDYRVQALFWQTSALACLAVAVWKHLKVISIPLISERDTDRDFYKLVHHVGALVVALGCHFNLLLVGPWLSPSTKPCDGGAQGSAYFFAYVPLWTTVGFIIRAAMDREDDRDDRMHRLGYVFLWALISLHTIGTVHFHAQQFCRN